MVLEQEPIDCAIVNFDFTQQCEVCCCFNFFFPQKSIFVTMRKSKPKVCMYVCMCVCVCMYVCVCVCVLNF